jgi:hypothetical protein
VAILPNAVIRRNADTAGKLEVKFHHSANPGRGVEQPVPEK